MKLCILKYVLFLFYLFLISDYLVITLINSLEGRMFHLCICLFCDFFFVVEYIMYVDEHFSIIFIFINKNGL